MSHPRPASPRRISGQTIYLGASILVSIVAIAGLALWPSFGRKGAGGDAAGAPAAKRLEDIPFDGKQAFEYLRQLVAIGPRRSGSDAMQKQQKFLADHFRKCGGKVEFQRFKGRDPRDGSAVPMANLIVRWHPERKERILLSGHYDTLPFPMYDPVDRHGTFVGANDNGSGVAILMELASELDKWPTPYGLDIALWDGEEFIFTKKDEFFQGSKHFAEDYARTKPDYHYRWGVLLDMVGQANVHLFQERNGYSWEDTRPLVDDIWATAQGLGVREFDPRPGEYVTDDHFPLHDVGKIPTCDLIDFNYPPWHTRGDTLDKCSALSLAKVGWVLGQWLKSGRQ